MPGSATTRLQFTVAFSSAIDCVDCSGGTCGIQLELVQTSETNYCEVVGYFAVKITC